MYSYIFLIHIETCMSTFRGNISVLSELNSNRQVYSIIIKLSEYTACT